MTETPYLVDSNVLLRWVQPNHRDYPAIVSAIEVLLRRGADPLLHLSECRGVLEYLYSPGRSQWLWSVASRCRPRR